MTSEQFFVSYLNEELPENVSANVPSPLPERFVTVEKTGSQTANRITTDTLAVQSWAASREEAMLLNEAVKALMLAAAQLPEISRVECETDYNYPDLSTKHPRYQALYAVTHYLN